MRKDGRTDRRDDANSHFSQSCENALKCKAIPLEAWEFPRG
jgi:hypothetical protein